MAITKADKLEFDSVAAQQFGFDSLSQVIATLERATDEVYTLRRRYDAAVNDQTAQASCINSLMHVIANLQSNMRLDLLLKAHADLHVVAERAKALACEAGQ